MTDSLIVMPLRYSVGVMFLAEKVLGSKRFVLNEKFNFITCWRRSMVNRLLVPSPRSTIESLLRGFVGNSDCYLEGVQIALELKNIE